MRFSVASNFDNELLNIAKDYPVKSFYAKLPADVIGGGRATFQIAPITRKKFEAHVKHARALGFDFNYLLNGACFDNREMTIKGQRQIHSLLRWMIDIGVNAATISNPLVLRMVKASYPQLYVRISVFAGVDHANKIIWWEKNGADSICLDSLGVNRDLRALKSIRAATNMDLELLANGNCLQSCALGMTHKNLMAHSSQTGHPEGGYVTDHCTLECSKAKIKDPVNFLRSDWIRPEDIPLYEALGYHDFKLVERNMPTSQLVNRIKAYTETRYDGNLIDLVQPFGHAKTKESEDHYSRGRLMRTLHFIQPFKTKPVLGKKVKELTEYKGMLKPLEIEQPIHIDNNKLNGFLEEVWKRECRYRDCSKCLYCHNITKEVVTVDAAHQERCLSLHREIENELIGNTVSRRGRRPVT